MSMSKKDFETIAKVFKSEQEYADKYNTNPSLVIVAAKLAECFSKCNPRFDVIKFIHACGLEN